MAKKSVKKSAKSAKSKGKSRHSAKARPASKPARSRRPKKPALMMRQVVRSAVPAAPKKSRPSPGTPVSGDQADKFRDVLSQKRDVLMAIVQRKKEEEIQDIGVGDEADVATHSVEKEMLFELTDSEKQTLDMIEAALLKLDRGVYGVCESCQQSIPRLRLQVMPWARYCVSCQSEQEIPVSE
jgi:DnaK suppressor protein